MNAYDTGRPANVNAHEVRSHAALVTMLDRMNEDFASTGQDEWENATLPRYLEALAALANALPQVYANRGKPMPQEPTWEMLAVLLAGATGYE